MPKSVCHLLARLGWSETLPVGDNDFKLFRTVNFWKDDFGTISVERQISPQGEVFVLRLGDSVVVTISPELRALRVNMVGANITQQSLDHLIRDQVIPRITAHEGRVVLHAGLVETGALGLAVCGPSGRGKSTLVGSLQRAGHVLHGDDAIVIARAAPIFICHSAYPSLRLLPDTLVRLFPDGFEVNGVAHYSNKLRVRLPQDEAEPLPPVPLAVLLFLAPPAPDYRIAVRPMRPLEACMALIENSFALDPTDKERARQKLVMASELVAAVPAFELSYPRDYGRLSDVRRALVAEGVLPPLEQDGVAS